MKKPKKAFDTPSNCCGWEENGKVLCSVNEFGTIKINYRSNLIKELN